MACSSAEHSLLDIVDGKHDMREWTFACPLIRIEDWNKSGGKRPWYRTMKVCPKKLTRFCHWDSESVRRMVPILFVSGSGYPHSPSQRDEFLNEALEICERSKGVESRL
jgi:hypothetical protein